MILEKLKRFTKRKTTKQFFKYGYTGVLSYIFVFAGLAFLVEFMSLSSTLSFAIIYAINYIVMYFVHLKYNFSEKYSHGTVLRFTIHIIFFYMVNNAVFYLLDQVIGLHYLISLILNIGLLFFLRFLSMKLFVFRN